VTARWQVRPVPAEPGSNTAAAGTRPRPRRSTTRISPRQPRRERIEHRTEGKARTPRLRRNVQHREAPRTCRGPDVVVGVQPSSIARADDAASADPAAAALHVAPRRRNTVGECSTLRLTIQKHWSGPAALASHTSVAKPGPCSRVMTVLLRHDSPRLPASNQPEMLASRPTSATAVRGEAYVKPPGSRQRRASTSISSSALAGRFPP